MLSITVFLAQLLAYNRQSINACWMNEWSEYLVESYTQVRLCTHQPSTFMCTLTHIYIYIIVLIYFANMYTIHISYHLMLFWAIFSHLSYFYLTPTILFPASGPLHTLVPHWESFSISAVVWFFTAHVTPCNSFASFPLWILPVSCLNVRSGEKGPCVSAPQYVSGTWSTADST